MAVTTAKVDMKDVYLYILSQEGPWSGTPDDVSHVGFRFGDGDFSYSIKKEYEFIPERGRIEGGSMRQGDEQLVEITFEGVYETLFGEDGDPSHIEMLMGYGDCATWRGLGENPCEPYATWLVLVNDPLVRIPNCDAGEILLFKNFFCEGTDPAMSGGTVSFSGMAKILTPEIVEWNNAAAIPGWTVPSIHQH
jgi:hypothetical protein